MPKKLSLIAPKGIVSPREERRQCLFKAREGREREKRRGSKFRKVDSAVATTAPEVGRGHRTYVQKTQRPYGLSWSCGLAGKGPLEQQQQQTPQWRKHLPPSRYSTLKERGDSVFVLFQQVGINGRLPLPLFYIRTNRLSSMWGVGDIFTCFILLNGRRRASVSICEPLSPARNL